MPIGFHILLINSLKIKMNNTTQKTKWVQRIVGLMAALMLTVVSTGQASARILFEDDDFFNINSEGIILDFNNDIGSNNEDITLQFGNDTTDAAIDYNGLSGDITLSTPGGDFDFSDDNLTTTGALLFSGSSEFHIREVAGDPNTVASCNTLDEIVIDTTGDRMYICTGIGVATVATWSPIDSGSSQDFEGVYSVDSDNTLTASGTFDIDATGALGMDSDAAITIGGAGIDLTSDGGILSLIGDGTNDIDINNAGAAIDLDASTFDLLTTGAFSIDGTGASNLTTDTGNLELSTTSSGDVDITGATNVDVVSTTGDVTLTAGDDIIFDDAQLTGIVQLTDTATDWDATLSGNGIVDNINSFTSTANGEGASNVGIEDASAWFTGTEIEAALNEIETLFGSTTSSTFNFTENNVLTDDASVYSALNTLDLQWGDLASTANGEGASMVGIEDSGTYFTSTDVEGALQEIGASIGNNYEDLTFYPEYPDSVINADGTNNRGTLESLYDGTQESGYYNWTTRRSATQDVDIHFAFPLPTDFNATGDFTFNYRTGTVTEADNDVEVRLYNVTDATECSNDLTNGTAGVWSTGTITAANINAGCTGGTALDAGDIVEVRIKLMDNSGAADYADIGMLNWNYTK